ncbi:elongation factor Tu GTP-binding domain-containing protein, putative, partial [Eimeria acervulina]
MFIPVSARTGYGLSDLEACIALLAESLLHLSLPPPPAAGAPVAAARGFVLEVRVHPKRGRVLHAIVRSGYLQEGAWVAVGPHYGRIKKLYKPQGGPQDGGPQGGGPLVGAPHGGGPQRGPKGGPQGAPIRVPFAGMNEAVEIAGLGDLEASAGQLIVQTKTQQQAAKLAAMAQRALEGWWDCGLHRRELPRRKVLRPRKQKTRCVGPKATISASECLRHLGGSVLPEVGLVLKAGDQGSLEALLMWIDTANKKTKEENLSPAVALALEQARASPTAALINQPRQTNKDKGDKEKEEREDEDTGKQTQGDKDKPAAAAAAAAAYRKSLLQQWRPLRVVRSGVGPLTVSDVHYAQLTGALVFAFGVPLLDGVKQ